MLAKFFTLFWIVPFALLAKSYLFSPVPAVSNEVLEIDIKNCDIECQKKYLESEKPFSFISKYDKSNDDNYLRNSYQQLKSLLNLDEEEDKSKIKIAVLVPTEVIGRYASIVTDSVNAYLLYKNVDFTLKTYDSKTESLENLTIQIEKILKDGFRYIIAPLTTQGAENLAKLSLPIQVFIPTINKNEVSVTGQNIIYGGIDYKEQFAYLDNYRLGEKVVVFDEPIELSKKLTSYVQEREYPYFKNIELRTKRTNFKNLFEQSELDENTTLILNTRPVMTSLILSQLTYHEYNVSRVFSTQLNYTPVILRLTQVQDLEKFIVSSSISNLSNRINESNMIFNNDIKFNWIIYSTTIISEFIFQRTQKNYSSQSKSFGVEIIDNSIIYDLRSFEVKGEKFIPLAKPERDESPTTFAPLMILDSPSIQ